jgi:hypothetical protein
LQPNQPLIYLKKKKKKKKKKTMSEAAQAPRVL